MDWIKVTPETMPEEGQGVILTYVDSNGHKYIEIDALFEDGKFKVYSEVWTCYVEKGDRATHWIPYPEHAEN